MPTIEEFIEMQTAACKERLAALQAERSKYQALLAETALRIEATCRELGNLARAADAIGAGERRGPPASQAEKPITIKSAVLAVLDDAPSGLIALDIMKKINDRFALGVVRTSLSPQLTRLKRAGEIALHGSTWKRRGKEIGPEDDASGPEPGGSCPLTPASDEGQQEGG